MGVLDDFLSSGQDEIDVLFGRSTMVCAGQTFFVVMNMSRKSYEGALGGLESQVQSVAVAQAPDVTNPKTLLQKRCTIDGVTYRIAEVSAGSISVEFTLADPNESR
jgi:hypothetical protein